MKEYLSINGGRKLTGDVSVSGAKNAALPLLMATLLSEGESVLENVPDLEDISVTMRLLERFGAKASYRNHRAVVHAGKITEHEAPAGLVKAMRASFWVLGPILARTGRAKVALPGGDAIGTRPVDLHLKGLVRLGADVRLQHGSVIATVPGKLTAAKIDLEYPSVGATHHLMMTAARIEGETILTGAAREPEIVEMANFLSSMGAIVSGAGEDQISIRGREDLVGGKWRLIGDRIEATTYLAAAAVTEGDVRVLGINQAALGSVLELFRTAGCEIVAEESCVTLRSTGRLRPVQFSTEPFPGVPTDVQALFLAALTRADGESTIQETVFESRFGHVPEYRKFGAEIHVAGREAVIRGVETLTGAIVEAGDIRAAAGLVLMGLAAHGRSDILEIHHLDRGYENMVEKLRNLGADVVRVPAFDGKEIVLGC